MQPGWVKKIEIALVQECSAYLGYAELVGRLLINRQPIL
jgi:hypothetical protein